MIAQKPITTPRFLKGVLNGRFENLGERSIPARGISEFTRARVLQVMIP